MRFWVSGSQGSLSLLPHFPNWSQKWHIRLQKVLSAVTFISLVEFKKQKQKSKVRKPVVKTNKNLQVEPWMYGKAHFGISVQACLCAAGTAEACCKCGSGASTGKTSLFHQCQKQSASTKPAAPAELLWADSYSDSECMARKCSALNPDSLLPSLIMVSRWDSFISSRGFFKEAETYWLRWRHVSPFLGLFSLKPDAYGDRATDPSGNCQSQVKRDLQ